MLYRIAYLTVALLNLLPVSPSATAVDQDQPGGWYMFTFNKDFSESRFGFQGDVQYRTWDGSGDLE